MSAGRVQGLAGTFIVLSIIVASVWTQTGEESAADYPAEDIFLVEHSSDIFTGRIDIVTTSDESATEYTVLTPEVLKGELEPQSLIVVRKQLDASVATLIPGQEYLLFARYRPAELRYELVANGSDAVSWESGDSRTEIVDYWSGIIKQYTCAVTDVVVLDGAVYGRRDWTTKHSALDRSEVGSSIATVELQDTSATGCRSDLADGSSSEIAAGTGIHELKQFAPTFRVAVKASDDSWMLYEVLWSSKATTGADLYDIRDRVIQVEIAPSLKSLDCDDTEFCFPPPPQIISDPTGLSEFTNLILEAPIDSGDIRHYRIGEPASSSIVIQLDDGSTIRLDFNPETGRLANGLTLPPEILDQMLNSY